MPAQHESPHLEFPVLKADYAAIFPLVFLTERSDVGTRARRPAVLQPGQGSMLLSASDSKVEDLAFDNLRLARRATALVVFAAGREIFVVAFLAVMLWARGGAPCSRPLDI